MAAFMLGWAGLSVHCQVLSFLADSGLSTRTYIFGKLLHGAFSAALMAALTRLFPLEQPVAGYLAEQVEAIALLDFSSVLAVSAAAAWVVWLGFFARPGRAPGRNQVQRIPFLLHLLRTKKLQIGSRNRNSVRGM